MKYILDTHAYIWYVENNVNLSRKALNIIDNPVNKLYFSLASIWEITIKSSLKKLDLKQTISDIYKELDSLKIELLQINMKHFETLYALDYIHNDPFDRMIISQAITEVLPIISKDTLFAKYSVETIW
jgi:PIN domain nuclease of toxin-antitoxin system